MKTRLYVIYDRVAEESGPITEAKNDGVAYRGYKKFLESNEDIINDDFMLLCVGTCDHTNNRVEAIYPAIEVYVGLSLIDEENEELVNEQ